MTLPFQPPTLPVLGPFELPRAPEESKLVAEFNRLSQSLTEDGRKRLADEARVLLRVVRRSLALQGSPLNLQQRAQKLVDSVARLKRLTEGLVARTHALALGPTLATDAALAATLSNATDPGALTAPLLENALKPDPVELQRQMVRLVQPILDLREAYDVAETAREAIETSRREVEGFGRDIATQLTFDWKGVEGFLLLLLESLTFGALENIALPAIEGGDVPQDPKAVLAAILPPL